MGDLSGVEVLSLKRQLNGAVRSWSNLPNRGLDRVTRLNGRGEPDPIINQRVWVVVPNGGYDGPSDETKCT